MIFLPSFFKHLAKIISLLWSLAVSGAIERHFKRLKKQGLHREGVCREAQGPPKFHGFCLVKLRGLEIFLFFIV